jgi:AcrR family transcriptional regulator
VNVAAVNYHFRDKQQLYAAVLQYAHRYATEMYPPDGGIEPTAPGEERLAGYIRAFVRRLTDQGRPSWHGLLMIREITEPTDALDELVEQSVRPQYNLLCSIVSQLLGPRVSTPQVRMCASSIVGQCMHFQVSRQVLSRLNPDLHYDDGGLAGIADHILRFSLAAIQCLRSAAEGQA